MIAVPAMAAALTGGVAPAGATTTPPPTTVVVRHCDAAHLDAAVNSTAPGAVTVIDFACNGTIQLTNESQEMAVNDLRDITLDGAGHQVTIDGTYRVQLFLVAAASELRLRNLTLARGSTTSEVSLGGGAVDNYGTVVADDDVFDNNYAFNYGGAIASLGNGTLTVHHSQFVDNIVTCPVEGRGGGALAQAGAGALTVTGSTFVGNQSTGAGAGGAVFLSPSYQGTGAPSTISTSTFRQNASHLTESEALYERAGGGAVSSWARALAVNEDTFDANTADYVGGAIAFVQDPYVGETGFGPGGPLTINASSFVANAATGVLDPFSGTVAVPGEGGAVYVESAAVATTAGTSIIANTAGIGGGIISFAPIDLSGSVIDDNVATVPPSLTEQSGGILQFTDRATITDTQLHSNHDVNCASYSGGSIVDGGGNTEGPGRSCGFAHR